MQDLSGVLQAVGKTFKSTNSDIIWTAGREFSAISSGNLVFDLNTQIGGFPRGRLSEVFGMEHSGKTSMVLSAHAYCQRNGMLSVMLDFEQSFDAGFAKNCFGLDVDGKTFAVFQPCNIEEGDRILAELTKPGSGIVLISHDSVDAMKPKALIESSLEDEKRIGAHAQAVARWVAKIKNSAAKMGFAAVFINQMRAAPPINRAQQNTGTGAGFNIMENLTTPGGMALRFYASMRHKLEYGGKEEMENALDIVTGQMVKQRVANDIRIINVKNKCGVPFLKSESRFDFPTQGRKGGWNNFKDMLRILKLRGRITQYGPSFTYYGLKIAEWKNSGTKDNSESLFQNSAEMMDDAKCLLEDLMRKDRDSLIQKGTSSEGSLMSRAVLGVDFNSSDVAEGGGLNLKSLLGDDESDSPISEVSM